MSLSSLCFPDTLFLSYSHALTDLNERRGLALHPVFVIVPNQEKATLPLPREKNENKMALLKLDW